MNFERHEKMFQEIPNQDGLLIYVLAHGQEGPMREREEIDKMSLDVAT